MLSEEFIIFEKKAKNRKDVLKRACQLLINKGIVQSEFARDVLSVRRWRQPLWAAI